MKKYNQFKKRLPIFKITMICILVLIIIGAMGLLSPNVYENQPSSDNQFSEPTNTEDFNVNDSEVLGDDTTINDPSTEEDTIFPESTIEIPKTSTELESCLSGLTEDEQARIYEIMSDMTLREKIYQMMIVSPSQITGVTFVITADSNMQNALTLHPVGGLFYNATNMQSQAQIATMLSDTQNYCEIPVLTMCDEEGGVVSRLMKTVGTTRIGSMLNYESQGTEIARRNAQTIASDMSKLGFNLDLAPVADVWSNPSNTVIAKRAYSTDFSTAATLIASAVEGFHQGGVACTLKHFPGHGDTAEDSHYATAIVNKPLDELRTNELLPFQAGIDAGADAVMIGHLTLPQVDEQPALFSSAIVTDLLREEMGFQGVVITDALEMAAIADYYSSATTAVKAVSAGVDMLLIPVKLTDSVNALINAVNNGTITEERINQSVARILALKIRRGILN
ncbi:MAG: glycoside hydrolase family 3 [Clostridia bacterium]|nr:glycoside hydrolase family 3 [Clostridia bacterium]